MTDPMTSKKLMDKTENLKYGHEPQKLIQHKGENAGEMTKHSNV
jgi:hypothetical protein